MENKKILQSEQQQIELIKRAESGTRRLLSKLDIWAYKCRKSIRQLSRPYFCIKQPVLPKLDMMLLLGMALGEMLGLVYALGREGWRKTA